MTLVMGRKSRCKRRFRQQPAAAPPQVADTGLRAAWIVAIGCAALVPLLVHIHTAGAFAGFPLSFLVSWLFWDFVSRHFCGKQFRPPSKYGSDANCARTDWLLFVPFVVTWVSLLFAFGSYADWIRGEHKWHGGVVIEALRAVEVEVRSGQ
jgi:hypothetical protein